jgi:hypothetical protein
MYFEKHITVLVHSTAFLNLSSFFVPIAKMVQVLICHHDILKTHPRFVAPRFGHLLPHALFITKWVSHFVRQSLLQIFMVSSDFSVNADYEAHE